MKKTKNININNIIDYEFPMYWNKLIRSAIKKEQNTQEISDENLLLLDELINEYKNFGYVKGYTLKELLKLPDVVIILFYCYIYKEKNLQGEVPSSIAIKEENSKWILNRDYCFFNIRAVGMDDYDTGDIINATKLLITLRVSGLHLAPFFECRSGIVYCQNSYKIINAEIINSYYSNEGIKGTEQMKFFIDCAHLLNMAVAFDYTPHVANTSKVALDNPELVRWVRLNKPHTRLYNNQHINEQYDELYQDKIHHEIREIVEDIKKELNIDMIDDDELDNKLSNKAQAKLSEVLQKEGYYSVTVQTWNGICIPGFSHYDHVCGWPQWEYKDIDGNDQTQHALALHTSLYIHKGMEANKLPQQIVKDDSHKKVERNEFVINYIKQYLDKVIEIYKFDYIRMDYIDHIFDNVMYDQEEEVPINEMLTPKEILEIANYLSIKVPGIGFQADYTSDDAENYEKAGFNLTVGTEARNNLNKEIIEDTIIRCKNNMGKKTTTCKVLFTIDTHDVAHHSFLAKELAEREGVKGFITRIFMSRFLNVGENRRPKYEVIGNQDMSTGIHRANNVPESLIWESNKHVFQVYHKLEDLYEKLKDELSKCIITDYEINDFYAMWTLENTSVKKQWLCVIPIVCSNNMQSEDKIFFNKKIKNKKSNVIRFHESFEKCELNNINIKASYNDVEILIRQAAVALIEFNEN